MSLILSKYIQRVSQEEAVDSEVEIEMPEGYEESEPDVDVETVSDDLVELEAEVKVKEGHELDQIGASLEQYGEFLGRVNAAGGFQPGEGALFSMGLTHINNQLGRKSLSLGVEDFGMTRSRKLGTQIATEDWKDTLKAWWDKFVAWLKKMKEKLSAMLDRTSARLKAAKASAEEAVRAVSLYTKSEAKVTITPKRGIGKSDIEGNTYKMVEEIKLITRDLNTLNKFSDKLNQLTKGITESNMEQRVEELNDLVGEIKSAEYEFKKDGRQITSVVKVEVDDEGNVKVVHTEEPEAIELNLTRSMLLTQLKRNIVGYEGANTLALASVKFAFKFNNLSESKFLSKLPEGTAGSGSSITTVISKACSALNYEAFTFCKYLADTADIAIAMKDTMADAVAKYAKGGKEE